MHAHTRALTMRVYAHMYTSTHMCAPRTYAQSHTHMYTCMRAHTHTSTTPSIITAGTLYPPLSKISWQDLKGGGPFACLAAKETNSEADTKVARGVTSEAYEWARPQMSWYNRLTWGAGGEEPRSRWWYGGETPTEDESFPG